MDTKIELLKKKTQNEIKVNGVSPVNAVEDDEVLSLHVEKKDEDNLVISPTTQGNELNKREPSQTKQPTYPNQISPEKVEIQQNVPSQLNPPPQPKSSQQVIELVEAKPPQTPTNNGEYHQTEANELLKYTTGRDKSNLPNDINEMELVWSNVMIKTIPVSEGCCSSEKKMPEFLLDNVSGRIRSRECLAIIGSSGAGKTTLLNYLSKKIETKNLDMQGEFTLNGQKVEAEKFDLISSYVMQDDILEGTMSPLEILMFTAKLKLNLPEEQIEQKVFNMINHLNLGRCYDTKVGGVDQRGVSGGERKRTSIGVELISDPKIIFLDEPTTGLDSYNAYQLIQLLENLAKNENKLVVFTIHQPSSEIFELLDKLCILAKGKTVFFGDAPKSIDFFESINLKMKPNYNPFEHFMEMTTASSVNNEEVLKKFPKIAALDEEKKKIDPSDLEERKKIEKKKYMAYVTELNTSYEKNKSKYTTEEVAIPKYTEENERFFKSRVSSNSFCYEFNMLFLRNMLITRRNPKVLLMKLVQGMFTAALLTALFVRVTKDFSGVQDRLGIILNAIVFCVFGAGTQVILTFADERRVFTRERSNRLYSVSSYFFAKSLSEIPVFLVANSLFGLVIYFGCELNDTFGYKYWIFQGILNYITIAGSSYALFIGTLASHQETLVNLNTALTIPLLLLSGFFANADNFAPYLIPLKYISTFKYGFQTLIHNEFFELSPLNCAVSSPELCNPMATRFTFLEPYYVCFIAIACIIVLFKFLALLMLYLFAKIKV